MAEVYEITTEDDWARLVDTAAGKVMVEFFVTWCPHCQKEAPILADAAPAIEEAGVAVYHANAEVMWTKGEVYGLEETPSFILVDGGRLVAKHEGFLTEDEIMDFAEQRGEWTPKGTRNGKSSAGTFCEVPQNR